MKLRFFLKKWHDYILVNVVPNQKYGLFFTHLSQQDFAIKGEILLLLLNNINFCYFIPLISATCIQ
jgi:hypothetical protein